MIELIALSKYFPSKKGRKYVFKDQSISLPLDRSIGVLGRNGAGKSTLIKLLGGSELPSSGEIRTSLKVSWPLALHGGLQGSMTGRENVRFIARINGYKDTLVIENKVADFAEIGAYFDEPVKKYSSGMRARVNFGLTMAFDFDFDVLLVDELTAVGDGAFREKSRKILAEKYEKTKIIMVAHNYQKLRKFCEAGLLIDDGEIQYFHNIDDAIVKYKSRYEPIT